MFTSVQLWLKDLTEGRQLFGLSVWFQQLLLIKEYFMTLACIEYLNNQARYRFMTITLPALVQSTQIISF